MEQNLISQIAISSGVSRFATIHSSTRMVFHLILLKIKTMKKNMELSVPEETVMKKIYFIRGHKVMLDKDLAELYNVSTTRLNQQVRRNIKRFPADFMFQLQKKELEILISQFATSSWGGIRKLPFVFTEQGVAMLSSVLNSDRAIAVNIGIMRIFTRLRQSIGDNKEFREALAALKMKTDKNSKEIRVVLKMLRDYFKNEQMIKSRSRVGYSLPSTNRSPKSKAA
jgi:hypothetical protein